MAQFTKVLVEIPDDKGVHKKIAGAKGEKYIYKYVKYFRNKDGKPRNRAKTIGKFDPESGKMYPNSNYYEMFNVDPTLPDISIWDYGYSYTILKACRDIGMFACLSQVFGKHTMDILVMAAYIIREGNAMDGIDDWQQRNYFPKYDRLLTSQTTSKIFTQLTVEKQNDFFKLWVKKALSGGSVCYDVTSISSYSQTMTAVERGYNRDGDDLGQYNLGMFCSEDTKMPIYFNRYNGSLTDRTNLSYVIASARAVGIERIKAVLDGGFWSKECFKSLNAFCDTFTVGMPIFLKDSGNIISIYGRSIEQYANETRTKHVYCIPVPAELYDVSGRILIYYDSWNHLSQCDELSSRIDRLKSELSALKRYPKEKLSRYTPYFTIDKHEHDSGFDYQVDTKKVEELRKNKGYFLIFSTDMVSSPSDILYYYRAKDADEKIFAQIKVDMEGARIRTHKEETTDGKTFTTFIACALRAYLLGRLTKYLTDNSTSMKKVFSQLSNITIISGQEGFRFTKALTKKQKQILAALDSDIDIITELRELGGISLNLSNNPVI